MYTQRKTCINKGELLAETYSNTLTKLNALWAFVQSMFHLYVYTL